MIKEKLGHRTADWTAQLEILVEDIKVLCYRSFSHECFNNNFRMLISISSHPVVSCPVLMDMKGGLSTTSRLVKFN